MESRDCLENMDIFRIQIAGEKVACNHLILDQLMQNLSTQDLLGLSLVNKLWHDKAREILRKHRKCEILLGRDPCRALLALNAETEDRENIFYNGIRHCLITNVTFPNYQASSYYDYYLQWQPDSSSCNANCLQENETTFTLDSVRRMYSNLLKLISFENITFHLNITKESCPFMLFIQILLQDKNNDIKELRIRRYNRYYEEFPPSWRSVLESNIFPNLRVIEGGPLLSSFVNHAIPNVREIINYTDDNYDYTDGGESYRGPKSYLFSYAEVHNDRCPFFSIEQPPEWKHLEIYNMEIDGFFERFLWASTSIRHTLKILYCGLKLLVDLMAIPNIPQFCVFKEIDMSTIPPEYVEDSENLIQAIDWKLFAPNLQYLSVFDEGVQEPQIQPMAAGIMERKFQSLSIQTVKLSGNARLFAIVNETCPNVTRLYLSCEHHINKVLSDRTTFPRLTSLHLSLRRMKSACLDFLLGVSKDELEEIGAMSFEDSQRLCIVSGPYSIINRRDLTRVSVKFNDRRPHPIRPYQQLMSAGAAALICSTMSGLTLDVRFREVGPVVRAKFDSHFDDLRRYASVQQIPELYRHYYIVFGRRE